MSEKIMAGNSHRSLRLREVHMGQLYAALYARSCQTSSQAYPSLPTWQMEKINTSICLCTHKHVI